MSPDRQDPVDEVFLLTGSFLSMLVYGGEAALFYMTIKALSNIGPIQDDHNVFPRRFLLCYCTFIFVLASVYTGFFTHNVIVAYSIDEDGPGGAMASMISCYTSLKGLTGKATAMMTGYCANILSFYRCVTIYRTALRHLTWVVIIPAIFILGEIIAGVLLIVQLVAAQGSTIFKNINYGMAYFSLTSAANLSMTLAIAIPLLIRRRKLLQQFGCGYSRITSPYIAISAILIESSALLSIVMSLFMGFYAAKSPAAHLFVSLVVQFQVIGPLLVIHQVARQKVWREPLPQWDDSGESPFIQCQPGSGG